jgi:hypothetical protein
MEDAFSQEGQSNSILGKYEVENVLLEASDIFVKESLQLIFPRKIIKRIILRPYLGRWYPYLDIHSPQRDTQLTYFYGSVNVNFTSKKVCVLCESNLKNYNCFTKTPLTGKFKSRDSRQNNNLIKGASKPSNSLKPLELSKPMISPKPIIPSKPLKQVPIALCADCQKKVYYDYWDCLNAVIENAFNLTHSRDGHQPNNKSNESGKDFVSASYKNDVLCENLLEPQCGFPKDSERLNPCLKDYGIGLVMYDTQTLKITIAPLGSLKYQMIWEGGLFGVILGRRNRIINLETLTNLLSKVARELISVIEITNDNEDNEDREDREDKNYSQIMNDSISSDYRNKDNCYYDLYNCYNNHQIHQNDQNHNNSKPFHLRVIFSPEEEEISANIMKDRITEWLIFSFLNYYNDTKVKGLLNYLLIRPSELLKCIVDALLKLDIEVLNVINIYRKFPPLYTEFRDYLEEYVGHYLLVSNFIDAKPNSSNLSNILLDAILKEEDKRKSNPNVTVLYRLFGNVVEDFFQIKSYQLNKLEMYNVYASLGPWLISNTNLSREPSIIHINELIGRVII